jgi:acyl-CoA thioesterase-1
MLAACGSDQAESDADDAAMSSESSASASTSDDGAIRVVVLGNSIAAGYGLDPQQAFPALLRERQFSPNYTPNTAEPAT